MKVINGLLSYHGGIMIDKIKKTTLEIFSDYI
jgi:hypothetical protein